MEQVIVKKILEDKKISIAIMSSFAVLTIQYLILIYFNLNGTSAGQTIQLISKGIVGFFYLLALPAVLRRNKIKFFGICFIAVFLFVFNYVFFNENWFHLKTIIFPLFFTGLPSFIYAYSINDWDILMEIMKKTSKITFIIGVIIGIMVVIGNISIGTYSMSLSYYMLLPAIIYMNEFADNRTLKSGIILAMSLLVILALGSRGAIMCIGIFIILKVMKSLKEITYTKLFLYLIISSILVVGFIFSNEILEFIYDFLLNYGIQSRTLELLLREGVYLSGRDTLYEIVLEETLKNPLLGIGLGGDRVFINGYVHNIFLELLANFGVVCGSIIIIILLYYIIKSLLTKDTNRYSMLILWLNIGFTHLLLSSSYLIDFKFWVFLGLLLKNNVFKTKNKL